MIFTFSATYIVLWIITLFEGLLILALMHEVSRLTAAITDTGEASGEPLPIGSIAPKFQGKDERSGTVVDSSQLPSQDTALLFLSVDCSACKSLADDLKQLQWKSSRVLIAFCKGQPVEMKEFRNRFPSGIPLICGAEEVVSRYRVSLFPTVVLMDCHKTIQSYTHPKTAAELKAICDEVSQRSLDPTKRQVELSMR